MFVSVILPFYNCEATIERCLRSLFDQDYSDFEIIAVNDCSTDNTVSIIDNLISTYPDEISSKLRIISHDTNKGSGAARTTGMRAAKGKYLIQVDGDDYVHPHYLSGLAEAAKGDEDIVICQVVRVMKNGHSVMCDNCVDDKEELTCKLLEGTYSSGLWNKLIKTSIIRDHEIYPYEGLSMYDDLSVSYRAVFFSKVINYVKAPLYFLDRTSEDSLTYSYNESVVASLVNLRESMRTFSNQNGWNDILCHSMRMFFAELSGYMVRSVPSSKLSSYRLSYMPGIQSLYYVWKHPHMGVYAKMSLMLVRWRMYPLVALLKSFYRFSRALK